MFTRQLSDFLFNVKFEDLPESAVNAAKMCVEDLIGTAIAGSLTLQGKIWRNYFKEQKKEPCANAWMAGMKKLFYRDAAALNAACAHAMDLDDLHNASIAHLGAVTIPSALAAGQIYHRSGRDVITAVAAGYEIGGRVGEAINPASYHFWHTTGVVGALCSAAAAGKLIPLDREQFLNAVGSAGTQAAGLWQFLEDGAMSKTLHTANATLCGLRAAELSALGLTAAKDILAGRRGLLGAMTPDNRPEVLIHDLDWKHCRLLTNSLKPYPCCRHTHSAVYCAELLSRNCNIDTGHIAEITDYTYQIAYDTTNAPAPATPYGCKFSSQYCIACMLIKGRLSESEFTAQAVSDRQIRELMKKISVQVDAKLESDYERDHNKWAHRLKVIMDDGKVIIRQVEYPYGDFKNPFDWAYEHEKFHSLADGVIGSDSAARLTERIFCLEDTEDVNLLFQDL